MPTGSAVSGEEFLIPKLRPVEVWVIVIERRGWTMEMELSGVVRLFAIRHVIAQVRRNAVFVTQ